VAGPRAEDAFGTIQRLPDMNDAGEAFGSEWVDFMHALMYTLMHRIRKSPARRPR
jgi:hypothetical protein